MVVISNVKAYLLTVFLAAVALTACSGGGELMYTPERPDKSPPRSENTVRAALFVDSEDSTARQALQTAGAYSISTKTGIFPYFDYVVISGGSIRQGSVSPYLHLSDSLLNIVHQRKTLLKPLRDRGIKVLLSISGGGEGLSFGCLPNEAGKKYGSAQVFFAQQCADVCKYYELDGVEFYDKGGESAERSPYPTIGASYWNGEALIEIPNDATGPALHENAWREGARNMTNMMSFLIELFGATASFQGDVSLTPKEDTPILVRETGYGLYLPPNVPRYDFSTTLSCLTYSVNDQAGMFGLNNMGESNMGFVNTRDYAPVIIDLAAIDEVTLENWSFELGNEGDSDYGLLYYINLQPDTAVMAELLSITSTEVFGKPVSYRK